MGRSVGGAAGAGCAGFSLVGILVSIGLVVWLGSRVTDGLGDTTPRGGGVTPSQVADLTVPGATFANATVGIQTPPPFAPGQIVTVTGGGFPPGAVEISTCLSNGFRSPDGDAGCDSSTTAVTTADADGRFTMQYPLTRTMSELGVEYDCAAFAEACSLVAHPKDAYDDGPDAPITFAADLPPTTAERPPDN